MKKVINLLLTPEQRQVVSKYYEIYPEGRYNLLSQDKKDIADEILEKLDLTPKQKEAIAAYYRKYKSLFKNETPEQRQQQRDYQKAWRKRRTPAQNQVQLNKNKLYRDNRTPEQRAQYNSDQRMYYHNQTPEGRQKCLDRNKKRYKNLTLEQIQARFKYQEAWRKRRTPAQNQVRYHKDKLYRENRTPEKKAEIIFNRKQDYRFSVLFIKQKGWKKKSVRGFNIDLKLTPEQKKELKAYVLKCKKENNYFRDLRKQQMAKPILNKKLKKLPLDI